MSWVDEEWGEEIPTGKNSGETKTTKGGEENKKLEFSVIFPDDEEIFKDNPTSTFVATLEKIGFERVSSLNMTYSGYNRVGKIKPQLNYSSKGYKKVGDWYIITTLNTEDKIKLLQKISNLLDLNLRIEKMAIRKDPKNNVKCEVVEKCGVVSERANGEKLEVRYISWNGKPPKYDIRPWRIDDNGNETCGKGLTLTGEELEKLGVLIQKMNEED